MKDLVEAYKKTGTLHHAYCIVGERENVSSEILEFFERGLNVQIAGNPDLWQREFDSLAMDDAREISAAQGKKAYNAEGRKLFLIAANKIQWQAQNALLKVFEEPTADTHFFLVMPSAEGLLPTLKSRLFIIEPKLGSSASKFGQASEFLAASKSKRLILVKKIAEEIADEKATKTDAIAFLNAVEAQLKEKIGTLKTKDGTRVFEELIQFRSYLADQAPSVKMILEHLALILPVVK